MKIFVKTQLIIFLGFFSLIYACDFDPTLVRLVDYKENVYIFRGNLPLLNINVQFAYDELLSTFEKILKCKLPQDVELYDICLLNPVTEEKKINIEREFFENNPHLGKFINNPIYGCLLNPSTFSEEKRIQLVKSSFIDGLNDLIPLIYHEYMQNISPGKIRILFIHCLAGKDRTGVVSAACLMYDKHIQFKVVKEINTEVAHREISQLCENELQWYAYYLKYIKNIDVGPID